ncbi:hypothetical protein [Salipiger sp.]|uniref:hypothetical protein n=1 Tax=Salipiger sp. TaxID=2078585 RepID=UPI003A972E08
MAVIALLLGSVLGFFFALIGWVFLDLSLMSAAGVYLLASLGIGLLPVIACGMKSLFAHPDPHLADARH